MTFAAVNYQTKERTAFRLVGSHTSTVKAGDVPWTKAGCAGCQMGGLHA